MQIGFNNKNEKEYQRLLNNLLKEIFFDFNFWYDLKLWDENYESYSIMDNGEIVSNICVYESQILFDNKQYSALSIGAVATKNEYRGRGFSRKLMENIIEKYGHIPMYLSANDSVVDFYPRFGFKRICEKLPVYEYKIDNDIVPVKLQFDDPKVWNYVYNRKSISLKLDCINSASINMFHIHSGYLKDCIYELPEIETLIIAEQKDTTIKLIGVFSLKDISFSKFANYLPFRNINKIEFGFMPYWSDINFIMQEYTTDPIFVRGISCDLGEFKFPELSIT